MMNVKQQQGALRSRTTRAAAAVSVGMILAGGLASSATAATDPGQSISSTQGKSAARQAMKATYPDAKIKTSGDVTIVSQGRTATGAWVEFTGDGTVEVDGSASATETPTMGPYAFIDTKVGGGRWIYGTSVNSGGQKACHSKYHHAYRWHSATAKMDGYVDKKVMEKTRWANAVVIRYTKETCRAYYNVYDN